MTTLTTFTVDHYLFGVDVATVQEVIRAQEMTRVPLADPAVGGLINLRGQVVTAIDLRTRLGLPPRHIIGSDPDKAPMNVVVRTPDGALSLLVDSIGDVVETSHDLFEAPPETLTGPARTLVTGAYKLDDQLLLALDVTRAVDVRT
jgi:purine-binding chemotaxis protein CheW